jgi:formylglycine-generating enzyme required for sulfatase activity
MPLRLLTALAIVAACGLAHAAPDDIAWPLTTEAARALQQRAAADLGCPVERTVELPGRLTMTLELIPAGDFVMGAADGESGLDPDETPRTTVHVPHPLWVGRYEVTNQEFRAFRPEHDSRYADTWWKDRVGPGYALNEPRQPVCRVSWDDALAFCEWLGEAAGLTFRLPTEAEWEYACRAGTDTRYWCPDADLPRCANFADSSLGSVKPWALRDTERSDGASVSVPVGSYSPNPWGLCDMHGNVAEWCASLYAAYPYDGRKVQDLKARADRVVRGGSWDDRPRRVRSAFRLSYPPDQVVYNVGFRVVAEAD